MKRLVLLALLAGGCATLAPPPPPPPPPPVSEAELRATIAVLASDDFGGRMVGTPGERKTVDYIAARFAAAGLAAGASGPQPYLEPFRIDRKPARTLPAEAKLPEGQRGFIAKSAGTGSLTSWNVIGKAPGRNPDGRAVVVMAHWDHLGLCLPEGAADRICNGAVDNASGVAAMIAVAERVAGMKLDRDVWFVATGAEEWGLLGAKAFADKPPMPVASIIAGFNLDTIAIAPKGMPVAMVAPKGSGLEQLVRRAAAALGRAWDGDEEAADFIQRQDGWALVQRGAPMVMAGGSFSDMARLRRFLASPYHGPDDELRPDSELGGAVDDANLHVELVRRAASRDLLPAFAGVPRVAGR